ncbi:beta-ketoacyl-ACP synthase III [Poriferisphaera sp. WC338]|uniref:beta-ketoacyl-ACP synthase III n=1 Tax=Poriferisphaera sp. WC338 TaxID=3425129 RepID=UPI003D815248
MQGSRRSLSRPAGVKISGTGMCLPKKVLSNDDLAKIVDTNDEWIIQRTGIKTRHISEPHEKTSDLATSAIREALERADMQPSDLDLVIVATMTQDMICPATAATVVQKLGAIPCGAFDMNIACTGFVAAMNAASSMIESGFYKHIAVVGADTLSSIVDWDDRRTCVLFGDAAGAAILSVSDDPEQGCLYQGLWSDGERGQALFVPREEADIPNGEENTFSGKYDKLQMNGKAVYKFAVNALADCVDLALKETGLTSDQVKMVVPHQSNLRMLTSAWKKLGFKGEKVYVNIDRFGNTSAATVGVCLHELVRDGVVKEGDYVIFVAQGGGLSWGSALWKL